VVDLSSRLGRQLETSRSTRILVVEVSTGLLGLIVDAVDGIVNVPSQQIELLPPAADTSLGDEIATIGERLIVLIDAERAFANVFPSRPARRRRTSRAQPSS